MKMIQAVRDAPAFARPRARRLAAGAAPAALSTKADTRSVQVAPAEPPSAVFLDEAPGGSHLGTLMFVDLSTTPPATAKVGAAGGAPDAGVAARVPIKGVTYGANGHPLLFLSGFDPQTGFGRLKWTNGADVRDASGGGGSVPETPPLSTTRERP